ncbi:hypothetical protein ACH42_09790 [Endozoicomonas sp. (ex Bugula neritina AB1)]|nr:hypothetical protein ACH42_09790 [Endozoicomonas sp. (ex Bugula neritina AB1)]
MSFSKEHKEALTEELKGMFCRAKFELNGHSIVVSRERKSEGQTVLVVYIDGYIQGKNLGSISDKTDQVAKQVYRRRYVAQYKPKQIRSIEKIFGKRRAKKDFPNLHSKRVYLDCSFNTASTLIRQFSKLEGIKLVELGGEAV